MDNKRTFKEVFGIYFIASILVLTLFLIVPNALGVNQNVMIKGGWNMSNFSLNMANVNINIVYSNNGSNMIGGLITGACGGSAIYYTPDGFAICNPTASNRTDFDQFSNVGYLYTSTLATGLGTTISFTANESMNVSFNSTFYKFGGAGANFSIKVGKYPNNSTPIFTFSSTGGAVSNNNNTYLNTSDKIFFVFESSDGTADSTGIVFNITTQSYNITPSSAPDYSSTLNSDGFMFANHLNHSNYYENSVYPENLNKVYAKFFVNTTIVSVSPIIYNGFAYFPASNGYLYKNNASNISQNIQMFHLTNNIINGVGEKSVPAIANDTIYIGSIQGYVYMLNASNITQVFNSYNTGSYIQSSPIVYEGYVYIGVGNGDLLKLYANNLTARATYNVGGYAFGSPSCSDGFCYFTNGNAHEVIQMNITTFSPVNRFATGSVFASSPSVNGKYIYVFNDDSSAYQLNKTNISIISSSYATSCGGYNCESSFLVTMYNNYVYFGNGAWDGNFHEYGKLYQANASNISQIFNVLNLNGSSYTGFAIDKNGVGSVSVVNGTYSGNLSVNLTGTMYLINSSNITQVYDSYVYGGGQFDASHSRPYNDSSFNYILFSTEDGFVYQLTNETIPYVCNETWVKYYPDNICFGNNETIFYNDTAMCGTFTNVPVDNGTTETCSYANLYFNYATLTGNNLSVSLQLNLTSPRDLSGYATNLLNLLLDNSSGQYNYSSIDVNTTNNYTFNLVYYNLVAENYTLTGEFDFGIGQSEYITTDVYYFNITPYVCSENWNGQYTTCTNATQKLLYTDLNLCGTFNNVPANNGSNIVCSASTIDLNFNKGYAYNDINLFIILIFMIVIIIILIFSKAILIEFVAIIFEIIVYNAISYTYPFIITTISIILIFFTLLKIMWLMKENNIGGFK